MSEEKPTEGQLKIRLLLPKSNLDSRFRSVGQSSKNELCLQNLGRQVRDQTSKSLWLSQFSPSSYADPIVNRQFTVPALKWKEPPSCGKTSAHIILSAGDCLEDKLDVIRLIPSFS